MTPHPPHGWRETVPGFSGLFHALSFQGPHVRFDIHQLAINFMQPVVRVVGIQCVIRAKNQAAAVRRRQFKFLGDQPQKTQSP
jgi:hypothetical protein